LSRRVADGIFPAVLLRTLHRVVTVALCVTVFFMGLTPARARAAGADRQGSAAPAGDEPAQSAATAVSYRLRDAVPAASFVTAPPDTIEDDDFFLPEETDNKKLVRDIAVFVIVAVFVAFFIIKVFIEEDDDPPPDDGNGKPITPPQ
jgi:hypothetical protein